VTRAGCIAVLTALLAACGGSSAGSSRTIVLDHSIGPVTLLEPQHKVEAALGKGSIIHNDAHFGHYVRYAKLGLDVVYAPGPKHREYAFAILTTSSRYRTRDGVGVGSTEADVARIKGIECRGGRSCQHGNTHNKPGTGFELRNGKVRRIVITILD
jgi:hypothetical protein